jgi:hypothetical protein
MCAIGTLSCASATNLFSCHTAPQLLQLRPSFPSKMGALHPQRSSVSKCVSVSTSFTMSCGFAPTPSDRYGSARPNPKRATRRDTVVIILSSSDTRWVDCEVSSMTTLGAQTGRKARIKNKLAWGARPIQPMTRLRVRAVLLGARTRNKDARSPLETASFRDGTPYESKACHVSEWRKSSFYA